MGHIPLEIGMPLFYYNNGQPPLPCIVIEIHDKGIADVAVFMKTGYSYRSSVRVYQFDEPIQYVSGEFCAFNPKHVERERRYPTQPDLWG